LQKNVGQPKDSTHPDYRAFCRQRFPNPPDAR